MKRVSYIAEFKADAVKQVIERSQGVVEVSNRLGVSDKSLYLWVRQAKNLQRVGSGDPNESDASQGIGKTLSSRKLPSWIIYFSSWIDN